MASGVRNLSGADIGISVTGNAGPTADEGKEVGLVYIGVDSPKLTHVFTLHVNRRDQDAQGDHPLSGVLARAEPDFESRTTAVRRKPKQGQRGEGMKPISRPVRRGLILFFLTVALASILHLALWAMQSYRKRRAGPGRAGAAVPPGRADHRTIRPESGGTGRGINRRRRGQCGRDLYGRSPMQAPPLNR